MTGRKLLRGSGAPTRSEPGLVGGCWREEARRGRPSDVDADVEAATEFLAVEQIRRVVIGLFDAIAIVA